MALAAHHRLNSTPRAASPRLRSTRPDLLICSPIRVAPARVRAGKARRPPFRPCHANATCSSLGRGHQYACGPLPSRKQAPATQRARQPALRVDVTLSWRFGSLSCGRKGGRLALPALARAGATLTLRAHEILRIAVIVPDESDDSTAREYGIAGGKDFARQFAERR